MTITLPQSLEEKISALPAELVEQALQELVEKHGVDQEKAWNDALQEGIDDIAAGRVTRIATDEEMGEVFRESRERVLKRVRG